MGSLGFVTDRYKANSAKTAFVEAIQDYSFEYGGEGYTGTVAEKESYRMIPYSEDSGMTPEEFAWKMIDEDEPRISDKWGPAGCIDCGDDNYIFFGYASY